MPVFFYIDPEFEEDPAMEQVDNIILSYTFFESKPGLNLPLPPTSLAEQRQFERKAQQQWKRHLDQLKV